MSNEDRFNMFGTCNICHMEVLVEDCIRLGYDRLYCSECYENMVHGRRPAPVDGNFLDGVLNRHHGLTSSS
jgi:hypothetical protein